MMFSNLSRRERIMLIFLGVFLVLALFYYLIFLPKTDEIKYLENQKASKQGQINQYLAILRNMPEIEERYRELEYLKKDEMVRLVRTVDEMLQVLEDEARKSGMKITSFLPVHGENTVEISMIAEGYFEEFVLFLHGIGKLNQQIEFKRISVSRKDQGDNMLNINGTYIFHYELIPGGEE